MKPLPLPTSKPVDIPAPTPGKGIVLSSRKKKEQGKERKKRRTKRAWERKEREAIPNMAISRHVPLFKAAPPLMAKVSPGKKMTHLLLSTLVQQAATTLLGNFTKTGPNVNM
jgi:hypothetical protein